MGKFGAVTAHLLHQPPPRTESYQFDLNGNFIRKTKRDGATIDFTYDAAIQLVAYSAHRARPFRFMART